LAVKLKRLINCYVRKWHLKIEHFTCWWFPNYDRNNPVVDHPFQMIIISLVAKSQKMTKQLKGTIDGRNSTATG
jgi:hypothetical protein